MSVPKMKNIQRINITLLYGLCIIAGSTLVPLAATSTPPTLPATTPIAIPALSPASQHYSKDTLHYTSASVIQTHKDSKKVTLAQPTIAQSDLLQKSSIPQQNEVLRKETIIAGGSVYPLRTYTTATLPNDPESGQWWESAINAPAAWDISTGESETILAIIDTGFALQHEEFAGRWHVNQGEVGLTTVEQASRVNCTDQSLALNESCNLIDDNFDGIVDNESGSTIYENDSQLNCTDQLVALDKSCNLIDDDNNGLADDVTGWDYINYDRSVQAGETNPNGPGTRHGSYVTAVAAGNTNNGVGIAGVNWNTTILPIQAIDDDGYGNSISVARAVNYAVAQGADVISMSLGGAFPDSYLRLSLQNAIAQGVVIAAASGNDGCDCISYPANYPEIIAVGALDYGLNRANFSSYGENLDITAPGVGMYTATWSTTNGVNAYASGIAGTSLATPLVGGALATLKSQQPSATPLQLTAALLESTDQSVLGPIDSHSKTYGFGRLDIGAASKRLDESFRPTLSYTFSGLTTDTSADTENIYQCINGIRGGNGIYTLKRSTTILSASLTNVYELQSTGYSSELLAYACVLQPHDSPLEKRSINTASELLDLFIK